MHYCDELEDYVKCNKPNCCRCCHRKTSLEIQQEEEEVEDVIKKVDAEKPHLKIPTYENELSIFNKYLRENLDEFRKERTNWIQKFVNVNTVNEDIEEEINSDVYKGRFILLRKIGFKTNRLRNHHKTLRPLKYYTLDRIVFESEEEEICEEVVVKTPQTEDQPTPGNETRRVCLKKPKKKTKKKVLVNVGTKDPAKRILEKLKAGRKEQKRGGLEPCVCENGKEVTFIIKGVCLCDKNKMKSLTTSETCGEYCKSRIDKVSREPYASDSLEYHRSHKSIKKSFLHPKDSAISFADHKFKAVNDEKLQVKSDRAVKFEDEKDAIKETVKRPVTVQDQPKKTDKISSGIEKTTSEPTETQEVEQKQLDTEPLQQKVDLNENKTSSPEEDTVGKEPSLVILYKNQNPTKKSEMALTKEQKKIIDAYRKKL